MSSNKLNIINIIVWFLLIVIPHLLCEADIINAGNWAIHKTNGVVSIVTGSFLHTSYSHLINNLSGILLGVSLLYILYKKYYWWVIVAGLIFPSFTMYLLEIKTVGISGLVYTLLWFIITAGLISRNYLKFFVGILLLIFYSYTLTGVVPQIPFSTIAWQNHLTGLVLGFSLAVYFKIKKS